MTMRLCSTASAVLMVMALTACQEKEQNAQSIQDTTQDTTGTGVAPTNNSEPALATSNEVKSAGDVDFPVIPAIVLPDFVLNNEIQGEFMDGLAKFTDAEGVALSRAGCDGSGKPNLMIVNGSDAGVKNIHSDGSKRISNQDGIFTNNADGSSRMSTDEGVFTNNNDGSGRASTDEGIFTKNADGSGRMSTKDGVLTYNADGSGRSSTKDGVMTVNADGSGRVSSRYGVLTVNADGSGRYSGRDVVITLNADGSGRYSGKGVVITNNGNGSGRWSSDDGVVINNGDGSGRWSRKDAVVINHGDGTGTISGKPVAMTPIPPIPPAGKFPLLNTLDISGKSCGFVITLNDNVLFDFDKSDLRPEAHPVLDEVAKSLTQASAQSIQISGHTDAKGEDAYNQALSERRANAVMNALQTRGVAVAMSAVGYGESRPVAPNEFNGQDNPQGRQQNRRVEIFVKTN